MKNTFTIVKIGNHARLHTSRNANPETVGLFLGTSSIVVFISRKEAADIIKEARRDARRFSWLADSEPKRTVHVKQ